MQALVKDIKTGFWDQSASVNRDVLPIKIGIKAVFALIMKECFISPANFKLKNVKGKKSSFGNSDLTITYIKLPKNVWRLLVN